MALHRMNSVTIGVPNVAETAEFYRDFNLTETAPGVFATADGGDQLKLVHAPTRRVVEINVGAADADDVERVARGVERLDVAVERYEGGAAATDPGTGIRLRVEVAPSIVQEPVTAPRYNGPGRIDRAGRSPELPEGDGPVRARPRKLGHVVIGSTDVDASRKFFIDAVGFKVSDEVKGIAQFLR